MVEPTPPLSVRIDPLKYLDRLPEFNGDYRDLQTFLNLIERVHPILRAYDELSQYLFCDLIKSKLKGQAREIIEINCQAQSWSDIKTILLNNFGDKSSLEELFDKLKGTTFKTNCVEFYNEIKQRLRSLNNKTITVVGAGPAANECARNNMRTALNIFKEKMPEPMKTILTCRNPENLENAMDILFQSGYAYSTISNGIFATNGKQTYRPNGSLQNGIKKNQEHSDKNRQPHPQYDYRQQKDQNPSNNYKIVNAQGNQYNRNVQGNNNQQRGYQQQNYNRNNWTQPNTQNRPQPQKNTQNPNYYQKNSQPVPEPMDINMVENNPQSDEQEYYVYDDNQEDQNTEHVYFNCKEPPMNYQPIEEIPYPDTIENSNQNMDQNPQNFLIQASWENYPI